MLTPKSLTDFANNTIAVVVQRAVVFLFLPVLGLFGFLALNWFDGRFSQVEARVEIKAAASEQAIDKRVTAVETTVSNAHAENVSFQRDVRDSLRELTKAINAQGATTAATNATLTEMQREQSRGH